MTEHLWWQKGVVYQVYPRSLQDSDGDGTGDLRGIATRLPAIRDLGVDAVWLSPIYPSPMTDFEALLAEAHRLGLKLILDFVPNHSSDQHPWFQASRARADGKADWYLWRDEPNNWMANFGGSGWTWDERRGQFYYHSFLPTQPDLNWRDPGLRAAMFDALRFWLLKGVDGVRVDVMWLMIKDDQFRDNPPNPDWRPGQRPFDQFLPVFNADRPEVHDVVAAMRGVLDEFPDRVLIGEIYLPIEKLVTYYGQHGDGAQLPFNFQLLLLERWTADALASLIDRYDGALPPGAWPNWVLGNHDRSRVASRIGAAQARIAAMLLLTLRGTPTIYMGEELGMQDTSIPADRIRDPAERREPGQGLGRDPERTPYPWTAGPNRGFTTGTPWLPIGHDTPRSDQEVDPASMLALYRRLLTLRRDHDDLATGPQSPATADGTVLRYTRSRFEIVLNIADAPADTMTAGGTVLATTDGAEPFHLAPGPLRLAPNRGVLVLTGDSA